MKKTIFLTLLAALTSFTFYSCKKSSTTPTPATTSQWTFNGSTFKSPAYFTSSGDDQNVFEAVSTDALGDYIDLIFGSHPTANGTFTVVGDANIDNLGPTQCRFVLGNDNDDFDSIAGGTVSVTINNGKVTAFFTNISTTDETTLTRAVSGTLIEQ